MTTRIINLSTWIAFGLLGACAVDDGDKPHIDTEVAPKALDCIAGYYGGEPTLVGKSWMLDFPDGRSIAWDDGVTHTFDGMLDDPTAIDLHDMLAQPYEVGSVKPPAIEDGDPGYFVPPELYMAAYGDAKHDIVDQLRQVRWFGDMQLPTDTYGDVYLHVIDAAREDLQAVRNELTIGLLFEPELADQLTGRLCCETFHWVNRPDMEGVRSDHAYGIAVDINKDWGDAWYTDPLPMQPRWHNRVSPHIVDAFERHNFIWGGRWNHFVTGQFMWRPEMYDPECML